MVTTGLGLGLMARDVSHLRLTPAPEQRGHGEKEMLCKEPVSEKDAPERH